MKRFHWEREGASDRYAGSYYIYDRQLGFNIPLATTTGADTAERIVDALNATDFPVRGKAPRIPAERRAYL